MRTALRGRRTYFQDVDVGPRLYMVKLLHRADLMGRSVSFCFVFFIISCLLYSISFFFASVLFSFLFSSRPQWNKANEMQRRCSLCWARHSFSILVTTKNAIISTDAISRSSFILLLVSKATGQPLFFSFVKLSLNTASGRYSCYRVSSWLTTGITRKWTPSNTSPSETRTLRLTGRHVKAKKKRPIDSCVKFGATKKKGEKRKQKVVRNGGLWIDGDTLT